MIFNIYSVEDDLNISNLIKLALSKQGYLVSCFPTGKSFFKALNIALPNMILLDINLPDMDGIEILKKIRNNKKYNDIEIIIISANNLTTNIIEGLDLGADDYISKPFDVLELMSRVNARVRKHDNKSIICIKKIRIDLNKYTCMKGEKPIKLTTKEFLILSLLFKANGKVLTREEILNTIWETDAIYETRAVDMHIKSLRSKLDDNDIIITVYGVGYKIAI